MFSYDSVILGMTVTSVCVPEGHFGWQCTPEYDIAQVDIHWIKNYQLLSFLFIHVNKTCCL